MSSIKKIMYADLTWPEVKEVVAEKRVALLPVGSTEQHGPHLPLKTDWVGPTEICRRAAERVPDLAIVLPTIPYGFQDHAMAFPGTISIGEQNFIGFVTDVCKSLSHHGFEKIIIANGHGSNMPFLDVAARRVNNTCHNTLCSVVAWWDLLFRGPDRDEAWKLRESEFPGGMGHACELETSEILYLEPQLVQMEKARKSMPSYTAFLFTDLALGGRMGDGPVVHCNITGRGGDSVGISGDPTVATKEKGEKWLEIAIRNLVRLIREWREKPILPIADYH